MIWGAAARSDELPTCAGRGPIIKVCGLTREDDVALSCELGAWGLGFVFAESPRRVTVDQCRRLVAVRDRVMESQAPAEGRRRPLAVGVFAGLGLARVGEIARQVGLDVVQLHGRADWAPLRAAGPACADLPRGVSVLPVVSVDAAVPVPEELVADVSAAAAIAPVVLVDSRWAGRLGGTGRAFDWGVLAVLGREPAPVLSGSPGDAGRSGPTPLLLVAGGIGPDNVSRVLAWPRVGGIDVSSGVESSPGVKDHARLRALFATVRSSRSGAGDAAGG